ncbi:LysR substrate-binding domain-containing protein [Ideonella azotifigens]|uniref:LysR family transcriptional regulator n=1 Tax=Ideonella azotifigens TaxID=513160 RepID=A0ABN1JLZ1_9BURK|nr:LysR substrate-binding domain-containing protein [Ideonella azotifigens]MCD2339764.1 LysR substrate-binding domain-containing protein [Ideonella azotifigens]
MPTLRAMRVFARVVDEGSLAAAARALDLAPAVVTRLISELETHLDARLLNRTTRRLSLTETGEAYLERVRQILADIDEAEAMTSASVHEPRGHVRLLTAPAFAVHQIAKLLPRFHALYPHVTLEITAPGAVEAVDESFDLTLVHTRKPLDGQFVARRLARTEVICCASPEYLDKRGRPQHPAEFKQHDMLIPPASEVTRGVTFYRCGAKEGDAGPDVVHMVPRRGVLSTLHVDANYAAALAGLGIAGLPSFVAEDALMEHALERVIPEWRLYSQTLWLCMPTRHHLPARTRALRDFLVEAFGGEDRDPWLAAAGCETRPFAADCVKALETVADASSAPAGPPQGR